MAEPQRTKAAVGELLLEHLADMDLRGPSGAVWGLDSPQLNANLVTVRPGDELPEHRNDEVDVLMIVTSGTGTLTVDGEPHALRTDTIALLPCGSRRSITADSALTYVTVHARRKGLDITTG